MKLLYWYTCIFKPCVTWFFFKFQNPLGAPLGHHWEDPPPPSLTSERWSLHWSRTMISISLININVNQLGCVFKWNRAYYFKNIFFNNKKDFDIFKNNIVYFYKENNMTKQQTHVHLIFQCLKLFFFLFTLILTSFGCILR